LDIKEDDLKEKLKKMKNKELAIIESLQAAMLTRNNGEPTIARKRHSHNKPIEGIGMKSKF